MRCIACGNLSQNDIREMPDGTKTCKKCGGIVRDDDSRNNEIVLNLIDTINEEEEEEEEEEIEM